MDSVGISGRLQRSIYFQQGRLRKVSTKLSRAALSNFTACPAARGGWLKSAAKGWKTFRRMPILLKFLDGDQEPSHQTIPKGCHFVRQTAKDIFVSFAAVNLCLKNFGSREHKKLLTLREVWLVHQSVWFPKWRKATPITSYFRRRSRREQTACQRTQHSHTGGKGLRIMAMPQATVFRKGGWRTAAS